MTSRAASLPYAALRPLLWRMDPEDAHHLAMAAMARAGSSARVARAVAAAAGSVEGDERLSVEAMGLTFRNPLGVAAGLDKDAVAIPMLAALGFGSVEVGTVTPLPQEGNPRPRVFRLPRASALVNRMGFPSAGARAVAARLADLRVPVPCVVGVNLGKNKATPNERAADDYVAALEALREHADYVAINVSSPNTPGLRALQDPSTLRDLVERVVRAARAAPVVVKLSPDLEPGDFEDAVSASLQGGARGLVVANTTLARPAGLGPGAEEAGGLSGAPLLRRTEELVRRARELAGPSPAIVGVGGIASGDDAWRVLSAGADLVQAYTALVYRGPALARVVLRELRARMDREGVRRPGELRR